MYGAFEGCTYSTMVARCRCAPFKLHYVLVILVFCVLTFSLPTWNASWRTEMAACDCVPHADMVDIQSQHCRIASEVPSIVVDKVNAFPTFSSNQEQAFRSRAGARSLSFHNDTKDTKTQPQLPSSERKFEGVLSPDGSISSMKLMMEGDQFEEYNLDTSRTMNGSRAGTSITGHRPNQLSENFNKKYLPCMETWRDLIPCMNNSGHLYGHCPNLTTGQGSCVILAPAFYARQFKWPASKNQVRGPNIPNVPLLRDERQRAWMKISGRGNTIHFGDGELKFPNGTNKHIDDLATMLPNVSFGTKTRVVLDIGCGTGNVAAALEARGVLTLSIAAETSIDNGVQLVLERGFPALVQPLITIRLPYPSQAFDLIHCAACNVRWEIDGGLKLLEADRILRAGGFFVWMNPSDVGVNWDGMEELTKNMCWRNIATWGKFAAWQKPINQTCYLLRTTPTPPLCDVSSSSDASWNVPLKSCLMGFQGTGGAIPHPWPIRLDKPPERLEQAPAAGLEAARPEAYKADLNYWTYIVAFYVVDFGPVRVNEIHNVLDMNAGYGGFAAAVSLKNPPLQWWVLNVVPVDQPDRLALIFDRGLVGVYHDWCEALDIYPRSFDLVHSSGLFSSTLRCSLSDIVQEMDRLLRPGGFTIIRDQEEILFQIKSIVTALHWKATIENTESGPKGKDKVLSCQKTFWQPRIARESDKG